MNLYAAIFQPSYNARGDLICTADNTRRIYAFPNVQKRNKWTNSPEMKPYMRTMLTKKQAHAFAVDIGYLDDNRQPCKEGEHSYFIKYAVCAETGEHVEMFEGRSIAKIKAERAQG